QSGGVEVIHLGHNRSVAEIVNAAIQEDVHAIAISSYQGGHVEYFKYMIDCLRKRGAENILVFGGGGGVIVPAEINELHDYGVAKIYSPQDGQAMGLQGMIQHMMDTTAQAQSKHAPSDFDKSAHGALSQLLSRIENDQLSAAELTRLSQCAGSAEYKAPVLGITGTGGAGKSSVTDEFIRRLRLDQSDSISVALLAIDPSRRKSGGALLGDRIRMNAIEHENIFMRSLATRDAAGEVPQALPQMIDACRVVGVDLIIIETPGIGQGDAGIVPVCDVSLYVMTPEFGAASQLEKIDMLDFADVVAINKFERKGGSDALRDVRKQVQRNREAFSHSPDDMPVFGTIAALFNDDGVTALYQSVITQLKDKGLKLSAGQLTPVEVTASTSSTSIIPAKRQRYLSEIADAIRDYHQQVAEQAQTARELQQLEATQSMLGDNEGTAMTPLIEQRRSQLSSDASKLLKAWPKLVESYSGDEQLLQRGDKTLRTALKVESLSGTKISRVALPRYSDHGDLLSWLMRENLPGFFPFTAGVFPFKREGEDPTRMFAGEGDPLRTNKRFKALSEHAPAKRLSTAFDSVTLYGNDPATRPDIYGKVGNAGVSVATVEDMQVLYDGFDLCDPTTSVSMTINGPAPTILAFFFITAFRQQLEVFKSTQGREPNDEERAEVRRNTFKQVRGTVQADILKEDQGQNTCIFSTEYSLKMMADIQEWFIENEVKNFYSVSISGYHIAEAGANPITQLALTLANGFTYVESYLARGMHIDDFFCKLIFFFSNGMDQKYTV
ncbi:UNVERIFIED_CONTAM: hypothetical protein GTU68_042518, partial [Idotea baltica]|nr:hypothetical protein [Idotea baltica]